MPNWAEGNIRFRGKRENLIRFFTHELVSPYPREEGGFGEKPVRVEVDRDNYTLYATRDPETDAYLYFRGSNRQFIDMDEEVMAVNLHSYNTRDDQIVIMENYQAAWNVDKNYFREKAKEYKIDIRTFVWELGMEWSSVITWYRNGEMDEETRTYSDWLWDASMPYNGG